MHKKAFKLFENQFIDRNTQRFRLAAFECCSAMLI